MTHPSEASPEGAIRKRRTIGRRDLITALILLAVMAVAAYLRYVGLNWDEFSHNHPDERFLTMVEGAIRPVESLSEYFRTDVSPLNPHNVGHPHFVYGTLPIFFVRYLAEWTGKLGYNEIHLLGRAVSATFDLITILLVYLVGSRLYRRRVGLLAAAFAATSVLLIQHSHFFVVDTFANVFIMGGIYFAVRVLDRGRLWDYVFFGLALGMAAASKISAFPLAGIIVLVAGLRIAKQPREKWIPALWSEMRGLVLAAFLSLLVFRILQPYAFMGTSFFDVRPNPEWLNDLREQTAQSSGRADSPPAWQWADRTPILFALKNMVLWGLGPLLGITAWLSWGWASLRMFTAKETRQSLLVFWTGGIFLWQSISFTSAMRYQLPVYPTLAILAAWGLWRAWDRASTAAKRRRLWQGIAATAGTIVLLYTTLWAFAFASIYTRPLTRVDASDWIFKHIPGPLNLVVQTTEGPLLQPVPLHPNFTLDPTVPYGTSFTSHVDGAATTFMLPHVTEIADLPGEISLKITLRSESDDPSIAVAIYQGSLVSQEDAELEFPILEPFALQSGERYSVNLELLSENALDMRGSIFVLESTWDDPLPMRFDDRDGYGGYYSSRNQELYWPDNQDDDGDGIPDKLERIVSTLDQGDYLSISSNRQYGSITRITSRYPLTAAYYRALLGCDEPEEIWHCGATAKVGETQGDLGYELVAVFQSNPQIGPLEINDQGAEEAFTVYDHPKVLIFAKRDDFSAQHVFDTLAEVDVGSVINMVPRDADARQLDLMLPPERLAEQREGGTWSELYPANSWINRSQPLAVLVWYLLIAAFGLLLFPWVRAAFGGLHDGGYPISRTVGLLLVAWSVWMLGSFRVPFVPTTIWIVLLLFALISALIAWRDRHELKAFLRRRWKEIVWTEVLALAFFLLLLVIRIANPDLWHSSKGGEKFMDLSYLNAVLKSTSFPPYDPWFADGYINYYYFGFVLVGVPVKMLGLVPHVAYNLILPTLFSLLALAAYSVAYNLTLRFSRKDTLRWPTKPRLAGIAAALGLVLLGNLGTVSLIFDGLKQLGGIPIGQEHTMLAGWMAALRGMGNLLTLQDTLPFGLGNWYWDPSRVIPPGPMEPGPITEFPFFTFLYADLHAHMIALPLTVIGLAWALSKVLQAEKSKKRNWIHTGLSFFTGALILGALRPTNTWDFPVYLTLGVAAAAASVWIRERRFTSKVILESLFAAAVIVVLALLLYQPFASWYGTGYTNVDPWEGGRTSLEAYLTVHGLFLFILVSWMMWETRQWMAATPISALRKLRRYATFLFILCMIVLLAIGAFITEGIVVSIWILPIMLWAGILFLRRDMPLEKRLVLILTAIALGLTFIVEIVVLRGDIGRMNTVFKFYLQVWTLFSVSAGAALAWLLAELPLWHPNGRRLWILVLGLMVFCTALYPITAAPAKMRDRMSNEAPRTLDGMAYMQYSIYYEFGQGFTHDEDYRAIRWLQENVQGSPVIVEANAVEYRWGSRYSVYTGLPGVLGWNWHQRQQRLAAGDTAIVQRAYGIATFYMTQSVEEAIAFLDTYDVRYVIVGQMERVYYETIEPCWPSTGEGETISCEMAGRPMGMVIPNIPVSECALMNPGVDNSPLTCPTRAFEKFETMVTEGILREVYQDGQTVIYEVLP
ncbi:MAG TPA: hypothetical protein G4O08_08010 [Anaerolineae bacterium]|nr:hypothetical protein [Anaerolineae bacterium]